MARQAVDGPEQGGGPGVLSDISQEAVIVLAFAAIAALLVLLLLTGPTGEEGDDQ